LTDPPAGGLLSVRFWVRLPGGSQMKNLKRYFYLVLHLNFISGFFYAFWHFINTPKSIFLHRRMWAYESWIIMSFYFLFVFLILMEREFDFKKLLTINLLLLVFPWGIFLVLSPAQFLEYLGLQSIYWRILGMFSLLGALVYYFPYQFYKERISYYILLFGALDNLVAGSVIVILFILRRIPLIAFSASPILFYFSRVFLKEARFYKKSFLEVK
jgi:hypothetical protein